MTEKRLREAKPGDRLLIHVEVLKQHPETYGVELATVNPEDGHLICKSYYWYEEAPAITPEYLEEHKRPYSICCSNGVHGICWSVKHASGVIVATFVEDIMPDAQKEAAKLRDKMNHLFNYQKK